MICDLHLHSNASDGSFNAEDLVSFAEKLGIAAIALTDHNTVKGLDSFMKAGESSPVITVPGIEISTKHNGQELHILGLFLPREKYDEINEMMEEIASAKEKSNRDTVESLRRAGYNIDYDEIVASAPDSYINRVHIAKALVEKCGITSVKQAFEELLEPKHGHYKESKNIDSAEAIRYLSSIGAVPVWAHPFLKMSAEEVDRTLADLVPHGLVAIETIYTTYDEKTTAAAKSLAEKYNLKQSGGSDFHGDGKPDIEIGSGYGNLCIPFEFYENLK